MSDPASRKTRNSDSFVSSSESRVESSNDEQSKEKEESKSKSPPVMKTNTKKHDQQEAYKAMDDESSTSRATYAEKNHNIGKNFETEIDTTRELNAKKQKWAEFSKKIFPDGKLFLTRLKSKEIQDLAEWINTTSISKLTDLQIKWDEGVMSEMDYKAAKALASVIKNKTTITSLTIIQSDIDNKTAEFFAEAFESNSQSTITKLSFYANKITAGGAQALFETLKTNTTITLLSLRSMYLEDEGAKALAKILEINKTITTIDLAYNKINAEGAQALAKMLKINRTITSLCIEGNNIADEGAKAFAEALENNPKITLLHLSSNNIVSEGVKALAETLKTNTTITTLHIQFNHFGTEGAKALAEALTTNTTITTLDILDIYFKGDGLTYIKMINQQCALNAQRAQIENNIAGALDLLTHAQNKHKVNITSVPEVNNLIAQKLFDLDKAEKLNTADVINDPNSVFNKYT